MFGLYLTTTGISFGIFYLSTKAYGDYLNRMGYVDADGSKSTAELGFNILSLGFKALIPGYNIYSAVKILWAGSKHFEEMAADDLKKGSIRKLTHEEIKEQARLEMESNKKNGYVSNESFMDLRSSDIDENIKRLADSEENPYNDMTNEEKLEYLKKERKALLQGNDEEKEREKIRKYYTRSQ